jgi:hypothetical protein
MRVRFILVLNFIKFIIKFKLYYFSLNFHKKRNYYKFYPKKPKKVISFIPELIFLMLLDSKEVLSLTILKVFDSANLYFFLIITQLIIKILNYLKKMKILSAPPKAITLYLLLEKQNFQSF